MKIDVRYRGKTATQKDVEDIQEVIKENPTIGRTKLSQRLCELWEWRQTNGALRDMVCRGFLLELERAGHIKLPPRKKTPNNPFVNRKKPPVVSVDTSPVAGKIAQLKPFRFIQVRGTNLEKTCNSLIEQYHYLGYTHPVGEQIKYLVYCKNRPIACFSWSSAPRHIGVRDKHIGWNESLRKKNLGFMAYNSRFLILPWIHIPHLASHLLGEIVKRISKDWETIYNHPVYYLETFVDKSRFKGTCYYAANWQYLGDTTGQGHKSVTKEVINSIKAVLGYPLDKNYKEKLCS
jgi:hypothetical protein